jgi:RecJ-like exonuclease
MDATANFSLRFARASDSKVETTDWLLSRQVLQRIATRMSLVSEAIGFSVLGILIIANRHQADLNGLSGGSSIAMVGGISAVLV